MSDEVINPDAITIPAADPDAVEAAGRDLKGDGTDIAGAGNDIKTAWGGLVGVYSAPEAETLFAAVDPVATAGDDFDSAVGTVGNALIAFAEDARPILERLRTLKADAYSMQSHIQDNEDWRKDEDKVNEFNGLNNDILAAQNDYMEAERTCANAITGIFGGTRFVAVDPGSEPQLGDGEQAYGMTEVPENVETPWATPQEYDAPFYKDVWDGVWDFGAGLVQDVAGMVGLYGENGWGVSSVGEWGDNLGAFWGDTLNGLGSLVGLYGENGWWPGSAGEWWGNFSTGWTEFAHAIVPWREWGDRPGYVITQGVLNIGSMFFGVGIAKALIKGGRNAGQGGDGGDGQNGDGADTEPTRVDGDMLPGGRSSELPTTEDLQNSLNELDFDGGELDGLTDALDEANGFNDRQPAPVGGGDTPDANEASNGSDSPAGNGTPPPQTPSGGGGDAPDGDTPDTDGPAADTPSDTPPSDRGDTGDTDSGQQNDGDSTPAPINGDDGPADTTPNDQGDTGDADSGQQNDGDTGEGTDGADSDGADETPSNDSDADSDGSDGPPVGLVPDGEGADGDAGADAPDSGNDNGNDGPNDDGPDSDSDSGSNSGPDGDTDSEAPERGFLDDNDRHVDIGHTDEQGRFVDDNGNVYVDPPTSERALNAYEEIRDTEGDTERISDNTGIQQDVLDRIKQHLFFNEHDVAVGPNEVRTGRFSPLDNIAELWRKADNGTLTPDEEVRFNRLIRHEAVESRLMENGIPYRSDHPDYWEDGRGMPSSEHFGAHDLAPNEGGLGPFRHYPRILGRDEPDFEIEPDLSNIDDLVDLILRDTPSPDNGGVSSGGVPPIPNGIDAPNNNGGSGPRTGGSDGPPANGGPGGGTDGDGQQQDGPDEDGDGADGGNGGGPPPTTPNGGGDGGAQQEGGTDGDGDGADGGDGGSGSGTGADNGSGDDPQGSDPQGETPNDGSGDADADNVVDTRPGQVDPDGIRRFDSDAAGEQYGETVLSDPNRPDAYQNLPEAQRDAVYEYTRYSWPYNPILRSNTWREVQNIMDGWIANAGPGWGLYEMNGRQAPTIHEIRSAENRSDLTPGQRYMVDDILNAPDSEAQLRAWLNNAGQPGAVAQSFNGKFPTLNDIHDRMRDIDQAVGRPLPEPIQVQRGLHGMNFMDGFDPNNPQALEGTMQRERSYMSTSLGETPALVDNKPFTYQMHLDLPSGTNGLWMGQSSHYSAQRELILPRDTTYKINKVTDNGDGTFDVEAEVVLLPH